MKFKIYDCGNDATTVEVPDKPIEEIQVEVITGDEIVTVCFEDGTSETFDSSNTRLFAFFDSFYIVGKDKVADFVNWKPKAENENYVNMRCDEFFYSRFR